jgi:hypothetical protein
MRHTEYAIRYSLVGGHLYLAEVNETEVRKARKRVVRAVLKMS